MSRRAADPVAAGGTKVKVVITTYDAARLVPLPAAIPSSDET